MAGVPVRLRLGPDTYQAAADITGGQLVVPSGGNKVAPAGAGALTVLGVALNDAKAAGSDTDTNFATVRPDVAVAYGPAEVTVTYAAAASFGVKLKPAANGQVTPWVTGTDDPQMIVGICTQPGGVGSAAKGRMRLWV